MRRILATDFGIWPALGDFARASDAMITPDYWSRLANYVLLYDQIVIPTGNLQILPVLRLILGESAFDDLVRDKGVVLARFDAWFGYAGNGTGLVFYRITDNPNLPKPLNLGVTHFRPLDEAIGFALAVTNPPSTTERRSQITKLLLDNVITLPTEAMGEELKGETYKDILGSPYLRDFLALRNAGRSLSNLVGIETREVKIFNPHFPPDGKSPEIQAVLRATFENFLLSLGGHVGATDITGDDSTLTILRAKGQRLGFASEGNGAFAQIQRIAGVPDVGSAYAAKRLNSSQLLDLRYSKHCQALRDWFDQGAPGATSDEIIRRYVESVGQPSWIDALPTKILRFAATTGMGALQPIGGALASAVDAFLLSKWFPGKSPRLFLRQAKVMLANTPVIEKPVMRGRDRNLPCSCGSGKKFKKCCGR
jgi:hypothetical protein